ncbi:hypothetical protein IFM89_021688 [Coptis chinensis]|uniref:Pentatricopeptide repeat-containing protein n=1 Tax=Coptis chinensis TaxID=261450 RepID=A0A835IEU5_9MAGN|nr:hypothetical protein IFM89_021688 [Coptis chinensis]
MDRESGYRFWQNVMMISEHPLFLSTRKFLGTWLLLTNIYASTGHWNEVTKMKTIIKEMKLKKAPAMSWIEVDKEVETFMAGDLSHPRATEIDEELERLSERIKVLGYVPDTGFVLQDLNERRKRDP